MVRSTGAPYHFSRISCTRSVELIRRAKRDGLPITADVTPHHLTLTVDQILDYDTNYKTRPPLRFADDVEALVAGLKDGTIDAIATDHSPQSRLEKATSMDEAAPGVIGLETAFSLCYTKLVNAELLTNLELVRLFTTGPAAVLNLPIPTLEAGAVANLTVIDPTHQWQYDAKTGASKSQNSPYSGRTLTAKPMLTIYKGAIVYQCDQFDRFDKLKKTETHPSP